ncbi:MAG: hypothetical protein HN348_34525 [Proteobacteria bacterium]|nr:hypothetical protein [Pseudomonadota bacterium]
MTILAIFTLFIFMIGNVALANPQPTCLSAYGTTACGYDCKAAYGQVACAPSPNGICTAAYGKVTCSGVTAPQGRRPRTPAAKPWPKAECRSAYGMTACGYNCVDAYGQLACASTPNGICKAAYGRVTCFQVRERAPTSNLWPPQECMSAYGTTACGYNCKAAYGQVACASVPYGQCQAAYGEVVCGP